MHIVDKESAELYYSFVLLFSTKETIVSLIWCEEGRKKSKLSKSYRPDGHRETGRWEVAKIMRSENEHVDT